MDLKIIVNELFDSGLTNDHVDQEWSDDDHVDLCGMGAD
jgi:hypothetical protein